MPPSRSPEVTRLVFLENQQTALNAGDYTISVRQEVRIPDRGVSETFTARRAVGVFAERFALKPRDVFSVFPPPTSLGEHSLALPHLMLTRSTLPWERRADPDREDVPWLALLVFHDDEAPSPRAATLGDLVQAASDPSWPGLELERLWQKPADPATVIDVERALLERILPSAEELKFLCHVRQGRGSDEELTGADLGVVIGNRLAMPGGRTTVHLVSLENRLAAGAFDFRGAGAGDLVRLVSLRSWSFSCVSEKFSFFGLLKGLDVSPATLQLPALADPSIEDGKRSWVDERLASGYVLLPRHRQYGGETAGWYHGPLIPARNPRDRFDASILVDSADDLYAHDSLHGLLDVSYAAAWQLGRLMVLRDKKFALELFRWKRAHAQSFRREGEAARFASLFPAAGAEGTDRTSSEIDAWLRDLALLKGLPFNYLVPDERMLPPESIRFFWIDWFWIECLLDGAFSIGRTLPAEKTLDARRKAERLNGFGHRGITGFLLRSEVVAGWPGLEVAGFDRVPEVPDVDPDDPLTVHRIDRLSDNVLIGLFDGELRTVDFYQKPEALQFGLKRPDEIDGAPFKELRHPGTGDETGQRCATPWKGDRGARVIDVVGFAQRMLATLGDQAEPPFTSADFALQMIEGSERVRIRI